MDAEYTGQPQECVRCKEIKMHTPDNFQRYKGGALRYHAMYIRRACKSCLNKGRVEWGRVNRERQNATRRKTGTYEFNRKWNLHNKYRLTVEQYDELLEKQNGGCAVCGEKKMYGHSSRRSLPLCVDHDHVTGKVRGLLCSSCNFGIGTFKESEDRLEKALLYLRSHRDG